jgi:predicted nucleotidyltransferase
MNGEIKRISRILSAHRETITRAYPLKRIGVFGSVARGEHSRRSDIDILVEFKKPVGFIAFLELEEYLGKLLKRKVDLVTRNALKPLVKQDILKHTVYL